MKVRHTCPICGGACVQLAAVDFNKSCEEPRGKFLERSGIPVHYVLCQACQFCFAPQFATWGLEDFAEKIYNQDYVQVDPDYLELRPRNNAATLMALLGEQGPKLRHLDFGGGGGLLSQVLRAANWQSTSFDPFVDKGVAPGTLGRFDLITAFEVFEHVPDANELIKTLSALLAPDGVVLFSTLVSDGNLVPGQPLTWWYASPRNGHISLFSRKSLLLLGAKEGFNVGSFTEGFHAYWKHVPAWASHLIRVG